MFVLEIIQELLLIDNLMLKETAITFIQS